MKYFFCITLLILINEIAINAQPCFSSMDTFEFIKYKTKSLKLIQKNEKKYYEFKILDSISNITTKVVFEFVKIGDSIIPDGYCDYYIDDSIFYSKLKVEMGDIKKYNLFYPDKSIDCFTVENKKLNGEYYHYDINGHLTREGFYKNNAKDSIWKERYSNGFLRSTGKYNGLSINILSNGNSKLKIYNEHCQVIDSLPNKVTSYKEKLKLIGIDYLRNSMKFPSVIFFKIDKWNYYNINNELIKTEDFYNKAELQN